MPKRLTIAERVERNKHKLGRVVCAISNCYERTEDRKSTDTIAKTFCHEHAERHRQATVEAVNANRILNKHFFGK